MESSLITTGQAAVILGLTRPGVAYLIDHGVLTPAAYIGTRGDRLLDAAQVAQLKEEREA